MRQTKEYYKTPEILSPSQKAFFLQYNWNLPHSDQLIDNCSQKITFFHKTSNISATYRFIYDIQLQYEFKNVKVVMYNYLLKT